MLLRPILDSCLRVFCWCSRMWELSTCGWVIVMALMVSWFCLAFVAMSCRRRVLSAPPDQSIAVIFVPIELLLQWLVLLCCIGLSHRCYLLYLLLLRSICCRAHNVR